MDVYETQGGSRTVSAGCSSDEQAEFCGSLATDADNRHRGYWEK